MCQCMCVDTNTTLNFFIFSAMRKPCWCAQKQHFFIFYTVVIVLCDYCCILLWDTIHSLVCAVMFFFLLLLVEIYFSFFSLFEFATFFTWIDSICEGEIETAYVWLFCCNLFFAWVLGLFELRNSNWNYFEIFWDFLF